MSDKIDQHFRIRKDKLSVNFQNIKRIKHSKLVKKHTVKMILVAATAKHSDTDM